jgi:hypothetical protein
MIVKLSRIGVGSAARSGFWLGVATSIANVIVGLIFLFVVHGIPPTQLPPEIWKQVAFSIMISGAVTALAMRLFALIYNSGNIFGGLELEFEMPDTPDEKRKNGEDEADTLD